MKREGNHITMTKPGCVATLSIPNHKQVKRGTLQKLIRAAEVAEAAYLDAFND